MFALLYVACITWPEIFRRSLDILSGRNTWETHWTKFWRGWMIILLGLSNFWFNAKCTYLTLQGKLSLEEKRYQEVETIWKRCWDIKALSRLQQNFDKNLVYKDEFAVWSYQHTSIIVAFINSKIWKKEKYLAL